MYISETQRKTEKMFMVFEVLAFGFVAGNSDDSDENTCSWQSMC